MDPKRIRIKGITSAHVRELVLDLDGLPEGLIAIVGPNGAGKTTLLESLGPLALFGRSPSRGCSVTNLAIAGDSAIELEGDHGGHRWRVLRRLDAGKGAHEGFLTIDGEDTGTGGRVRDLDDQVARRFLPPALYLASIYAAQHGRGSFVGLKEAERRDLFADLLGIGALQGLSEEAQKVAAAAADALGEVDRRLARARESLGRADELQAQVDAKAAELAAQETDRQAAAQAWEEAKEAARQLGASVRQARQAIEELERQDGAKAREIEGNRQAVAELGSEIARWAAACEGLADRRAELQAAEAAERQEGQARARLEAAERRGSDLQAERDRLCLRLGQARAELEELAGPDPDDRIRGAQGRAELAGGLYAQADGRHREIQAQLGEARGALAELSRGGDTVEALEKARAELDTIQARHALLAAALGRKGVQAHEIDGAGPMVSGLVNDLLGSCYGDRFRAELVTKQEAEKGRKEREVFELRIWDAARGDRRSFDDLSGGEQVVIDEALKLALALLTSRRSGIRCGALFRDEVDGKLDTDNAEAYPRMLRRALDLGGFRRVYFVSHRAEVYGQADARIQLGGDGPRVEVA